MEAPAVPALPVLCPSANQHPEVPSRARATAQTPRPPMSVALRDKKEVTKVSVAWFTAQEADVFMLTPEYAHEHAATRDKAQGDD